MKLSKEKLDIYEKNLQCLQDAADELMRRMKGHDYSFRREITDKKGEFSPEKLHSLVEEMLSLWEEKQYVRFPKAGWAKSYLQTRRELYGLYLYLTMRCSLYQDGYFYVWGSERKARTDFAFLLEQAKWFSRSWCITDGPDNSRQNEPHNGYDKHFGFHLYSPINHYITFQELNVRGLEDDWALTPPYRRAENRLYSETIPSKETEVPEEAEQPQETEELEMAEQIEETGEPGMDVEDLYEDGDYDYDDDGYDYGYDDEYYDDPSWVEAENEYQGELEARNWNLLQLILGFEDMGEYCSACQRFEELFKGAETEILGDFCRELEDIVNLYLAQREAAPLADTEKALDVYSRICEGPLRQAKIYGRGLQWKDL